MTSRVLFYVQHLLGVGHVYRATRVAHSLAKAGADVHLVWGGTEVPGFDFRDITVHRLSAVRSGDVSFSELVHSDGTPFTEMDKASRRGRLLSLLEDIRPGIVVTEAFPFGRRQMRYELVPFLEAAKAANPKPLIVASIRDIMQENRRRSRVEESVDYVKAYYDLVLVHGDQNMISIDETLQGVEHFKDKIRYTGIVAPDPIFEDLAPEFQSDILVTVGGGAFGEELARTAIEASKHSAVASLQWLISTGSEMPEEQFQHLASVNGGRTKVVRFIPNLMSVMRASKISVSHAGYNTVADLLRSETSAILYPFTGGRETEQLRRAQLMQEAGLAKMIEPGTLSVETLIAAAQSIMHAEKTVPPFDLEGADKSARILLQEASVRE